jgi:hypothetical protein
VGLALVILVSSATAEPTTILVEDWSKPSHSGTGIPEGWSGHRWGNASDDFAVITDGPDRVLRLRSRGDNSTMSKAVAQIYVAFPRSPTALRSRINGYVWDTTAPADTIVTSESSRLVTYVAVRSGAAELGRWLTETRNVRDDYLRIYGEAPAEDVGAVSVAIDSNDTRSSAESYIAAIVFRKL